MTDSEEEDLYRRLAQTRRLMAESLDQMTRDRLRGYAASLEEKLSAIEARDTNAPE